MVEREGALGDRLVYVNSCEERTNSRETALDVRAAKLEVNEGGLIKRRSQLHDMMNDQLAHERQAFSCQLQEGEDARSACWH